ncbi:MAG: ATP-binding protein [Gammaproteobacteria bacterium]|nr:ATP-binding protein [Gammaproteobacteria bacterium]
MRDYGPGIDDEDKEKIFEPFVRLDSARNHNKPGFGLGLSIAKSIIVLHDGRISVCRKGDEITEFLIEFPASSEC